MKRFTWNDALNSRDQSDVNWSCVTFKSHFNGGILSWVNWALSQDASSSDDFLMELWKAVEVESDWVGGGEGWEVDNLLSVHETAEKGGCNSIGDPIVSDTGKPWSAGSECSVLADSD